MELWIKSQDKEMLIKVDRIGIEKFGEGYGIVTYERIGTKKEFGLGLYKTKERALEVLDEIQNILNPMIVFKNCNCTKDMLDKIKEVGACVVSDNSHIEQLSTCVYEMPKE